MGLLFCFLIVKKRKKTLDCDEVFLWCKLEQQEENALKKSKCIFVHILIKIAIANLGLLCLFVGPIF